MLTTYLFIITKFFWTNIGQSQAHRTTHSSRQIICSNTLQTEQLFIFQNAIYLILYFVIIN